MPRYRYRKVYLDFLEGRDLEYKGFHSLGTLIKWKLKNLKRREVIKIKESNRYEKKWQRILTQILKATRWGLVGAAEIALLFSALGILILSEKSIGSNVRRGGVENYPRVMDSPYPASGNYVLIAKYAGGCKGRDCIRLKGVDGFLVIAEDNLFLGIKGREKNDPWRRFKLSVNGIGAKVISQEDVTEQEVEEERKRLEAEKPSPPGTWRKEGRGFFRNIYVVRSTGDGAILQTDKGEVWTSDLLAPGSEWYEMFIDRDSKSSRRVLKRPYEYICIESMRVTRTGIAYSSFYSLETADLGYHLVINCSSRK